MSNNDSLFNNELLSYEGFSLSDNYVPPENDTDLRRRLREHVERYEREDRELLEETQGLGIERQRDEGRAASPSNSAGSRISETQIEEQRREEAYYHMQQQRERQREADTRNIEYRREEGRAAVPRNSAMLPENETVVGRIHREQAGQRDREQRRSQRREVLRGLRNLKYQVQAAGEAVIPCGRSTEFFNRCGHLVYTRHCNNILRLELDGEPQDPTTCCDDSCVTRDLPLTVRENMRCIWCRPGQVPRTTSVRSDPGFENLPESSIIQRRNQYIPGHRERMIREEELQAQLREQDQQMSEQHWESWTERVTKTWQHDDY
jgi:hypothetical protein